jgi:hypothetical protein
MLQLDHITVVAPCLEEGVAHVKACLDLDVPFGRRHEYMGTHNHLMRLGEAVYLEIVALDPAGQGPGYARWFGLDDQRAVRAAWDEGHRLRGWVARTHDIDAVLAGNEAYLGRKVELTANNASFYFSIPTDGSLPFGGAAPSVIDRKGKPPSVATMADFGATLRSLTLEHPDPNAVSALYQRLGVDRPPQIRRALKLRYRVEIETAGGLKELTCAGGVPVNSGRSGLASGQRDIK